MQNIIELQNITTLIFALIILVAVIKLKINDLLQALIQNKISLNRSIILALILIVMAIIIAPNFETKDKMIIVTTIIGILSTKLEKSSKDAKNGGK